MESKMYMDSETGALMYEGDIINDFFKDLGRNLEKYRGMSFNTYLNEKLLSQEITELFEYVVKIDISENVAIEIKVLSEDDERCIEKAVENAVRVNGLYDLVGSQVDRHDYYVVFGE